MRKKRVDESAVPIEGRLIHSRAVGHDAVPSNLKMKVLLAEGGEEGNVRLDVGVCGGGERGGVGSPQSPRKLPGARKLSQIMLLQKPAPTSPHSRQPPLSGCESTHEHQTCVLEGPAPSACRLPSN